MRLYFEFETNHITPYINYAIFRYKGKYYKVDRQTTYYGIEDGKMQMEWRGLYIWDGDKELSIPPDFFRKAKFIKLDVEDDAPSDYVVNNVEWAFD